MLKTSKMYNKGVNRNYGAIGAEIFRMQKAFLYF